MSSSFLCCSLWTITSLFPLETLFPISPVLTWEQRKTGNWREISLQLLFLSLFVLVPTARRVQAPRGPQVSVLPWLIPGQQEVDIVSASGDLEEDDERQQLRKHSHLPLLPISHLCCCTADTWSDLMSASSRATWNGDGWGAGPTGTNFKKFKCERQGNSRDT